MTGPLVWIELKLLAREPVTLLVGLLFPIVLLVLLAGSFGNEVDPDFGGIGGVDFYVPVYAAATIAVMGLLGIPTHLATYRHGGVLHRFRASGLSPTSVMSAQLAVSTLLVAVGVAAMLTIGFLAYELSPPGSAWGVVVGFATGTVAFTGLGLLLGSLLTTPRAAQGFGLLLFFGLFFIAGGGPPPALLPEAINRFVDVTPMGPLMTAVSDPWHGRGVPTASLVVLVVVGVVSAAIAGRRLRRA